VREFALECLDHLVDRGVKALVIACNTASAAMLHDARERYDVPVIEVIRPAVRRAAAATRTNRVGVISTMGTHASRAYPDTFAAAPHIEVTSQPCPRFVEFVENGVTGGDELLAVAREYLAPLQEAEVDTLILGCTTTLAHRRDLLRHGRSGHACFAGRGDGQGCLPSAGRRRRAAPRRLPAPRHEFVTTGDPQTFSRLARRFLGPEAAIESRREAVAPG
jgi:glutamate racemase